MHGKRAVLNALLILACAALALIHPAQAADGNHYPRLALRSSWIDRWVTTKDSLEFLLKFEEISGINTPSAVLTVLDAALAEGYADWVDSVTFISVLSPQETGQVVPDADGKLPRWVYEGAREALDYAILVAVYHNLRDHGVDWLLHDADGDTMCVWDYPSCPRLLLNATPWCPRGKWDGHVVKEVNGRVYEYDLGSTAGKTYMEWLCTVALDSLFLRNDAFLRAFDGIQFEAPGRSLPCGMPYKPGGEESALPDPKGDGVGIQCESRGEDSYEDLTRATFDSLLTHFARPIRDAGLVVRRNGHDLRWALDPGVNLEEDTLSMRTYMGAHLEDYGSWGGWPARQTGTIWFEVYEGLETFYRPVGDDAAEGWDVSTVQSVRGYQAFDRDRWTRLNLGQALMGDGYFSGMACREDPSFRKYLQGERAFAPRGIPEMEFELGEALGGYRLFDEGGRSLLYRHFRGAPAWSHWGITVAVNTYEDSLGGVPRRDAQWFFGLQTGFPVPPSLLVFDHWSEPPEPRDCGPLSGVRAASFSPTIDFELAADASVRVAIHDVAGRLLRTLTEHYMTGRRAITWDGRDESGHPVRSGVYLYRIEAGGCRCDGRIILIR